MLEHEKLLSAREAALWLQVNPKNAQLRARRALRAGDPAVRTVAGAYVAPDWWWQTTLAKPIKVGRPRKNEPQAQPLLPISSQPLSFGSEGSSWMYSRLVTALLQHPTPHRYHFTMARLNSPTTGSIA
jgi:hypothetical protein